MLPELPAADDGELLQYRREEVVGRAVIVRASDGEGDYWQMTAASAVPGAVALARICYEDPADRQWAIDTWHSLAHRSAKSI